MEAILTMDLNNGLSKEGIIPWKCKKDLNFFCGTTKNNVVIMGKNTYLSLPENERPLKNRLNIVLSSHPDLFLNESSNETKNNDVIFTNNDKVYSAILNYREKYCELYPALSMNFKIIFIGGKKIYDQYIPLCDVVWVTRIKKCYSCDLIFDYDIEKQFKAVLFWEDDEIKIIKYIKRV